MTPAVKLLDKLNINYQLHSYEHEDSVISYGQEAAEKLAINAQQVFKTLVVETDKKTLAVAIIPVKNKLNLKYVAKSLKCKKVTMAEPKKVQTTTGYILGGVSPLAQKRRLPTVIDQSSQAFNSIYISGANEGLKLK